AAITVAPAAIEQLRPTWTSAPMTAPAPMRVPAPIVARAPTTAIGSISTPDSSTAVSSTKAAGWTPDPGDTTADGRNAAGCNSAPALAKAVCGVGVKSTGIWSGIIDLIASSQRIADALHVVSSSRPL